MDDIPVAAIDAFKDHCIFWMCNFTLCKLVKSFQLKNRSKKVIRDRSDFLFFFLKNFIGEIIHSLIDQSLLITMVVKYLQKVVV